MTVKELIEKLQKFDPELPVVTHVRMEDGIAEHDDVDVVFIVDNVFNPFGDGNVTYPQAVVLT